MRSARAARLSVEPLLLLMSLLPEALEPDEPEAPMELLLPDEPLVLGLLLELDEPGVVVVVVVVEPLVLGVVLELEPLAPIDVPLLEGELLEELLALGDELLESLELGVEADEPVLEPEAPIVPVELLGLAVLLSVPPAVPPLVPEAPVAAEPVPAAPLPELCATAKPPKARAAAAAIVVRVVLIAVMWVLL